MKAIRFLAVSFVLWAVLAIYYFPIIERAGGMTFGLIQDISSIYGFFPWDTFSLKELEGGYFPLWNPHNALGEPHLANMQTAVFYPLTWLKFAFGMNPRALDFLLLFRLYLAGVFTYFFARRMNIGTAASLVSALSFMLTGYFTRHVYMSHLNVEILIPLVMLVFGELARGGCWKWFAAAVATVWLTIVAGFPEATVYALALGCLYYLWLAPPKKWALLAGAVALGALASAEQALPFIEYVSHAWFYHPAGVGGAHRELKYFFTLWAPWFFGTNGVSPLSPVLAPYIGVAPIVLAVSVLGRWRVKRRWFFAVAAAVCFGLIYGVPPFSWLGGLPLLDISINYKYAMPSAGFCVAVLAGAGAKELLDGFAGRRVLIAAAALAGIVIFAVVLDSFNVFPPYHRAADWRALAEPLASAVLISLVVLLVTFGRKRTAAFLLVLSCAFQPVKGNDPKYNDAVDFARKSPEAAYLAARKGQGRFCAQDHIMFPNINLLLGLDDLRYYNPLYGDKYADFMMKGDGIKTYADLRRHFADHAMLVPEQDTLLDGWWKSAHLRWWLGEGPPGAVDLLPRLLCSGSWRVEREGMIGRNTFRAAGKRSPALLAHAPAMIKLNIRIPEKGSLRFKPLLLPGAAVCTDGAVFTVLVDDGAARSTLFSMFVNPTIDSDTEYTVPLRDYTRKKATLVFLTTPGPENNRDCDWSAWATPSLGDMNPSGWFRRRGNLDRIWERTGDAKWAWTEGECGREGVDVKRPSSQLLEVKSPRCREGGAVVISYASSPGWRAFSEGREVKIGAFEGVFQSVKGGGNFRLVYEPFGFRIGLWVGASSIITWFAFLLILWFTRRLGQDDQGLPRKDRPDLSL